MVKLRANPYSRLHWLQAAELLNLLVASRQAAQPTGCKPHDYLPVRRDFKALRPKRTFAGPGAKFPCLFKSAQISSKRFSDACCKAPPGHHPSPSSQFSPPSLAGSRKTVELPRGSAQTKKRNDPGAPRNVAHVQSCSYWQAESRSR